MFNLSSHSLKKKKNEGEDRLVGVVLATIMSDNKKCRLVIVGIPWIIGLLDQSWPGVKQQKGE